MREPSQSTRRDAPASRSNLSKKDRTLVDSVTTAVQMHTPQAGF